MPPAGRGAGGGSHAETMLTSFSKALAACNAEVRVLLSVPPSRAAEHSRLDER